MTTKPKCVYNHSYLNIVSPVENNGRFVGKLFVVALQGQLGQFVGRFVVENEFRVPREAGNVFCIFKLKTFKQKIKFKFPTKLFKVRTNECKVRFFKLIFSCFLPRSVYMSDLTAPCLLPRACCPVLAAPCDFSWMQCICWYIFFDYKIIWPQTSVSKVFMIWLSIWQNLIVLKITRGLKIRILKSDV